jgi:hypothetical protein
MSRRAAPTDPRPADLHTPVEKLTPSTRSPDEDELVAICRTAVGDTLRSVIHFTREESELLYLRTDVRKADRRRTLEVKATLVERERVGFSPDQRYDPQWAGAGSDPTLGDYEFTVRVFSEGFVCRIISGDHGLLLTAEELDVGRVEEVAIALRGLLADAYEG